MSVSLGVAAIGLLLTLIALAWLQYQLREDARERFERNVAVLEGNIVTRFDRLMYGLEGLRSYFSAVEGHVSRETFQAWASSRRVREVFPGIRGFGFIERVERSGLAFWVDTVRADYAPDFKVRTQGAAPDLYIIKFIEPLDNNRPAWGYDVGSEPVRREAIERAINSGEPALTGRITLVQDGQKRPGYLYYLPVYKSAMALGTPKQRRDALLGVVYAPIVIDEFLNGVADLTAGLLNVALFDTPEADPAARVFVLGASSQASVSGIRLSDGVLRMQRTLSVGGRRLLLSAEPTPRFHQSIDTMAPVWIGLLGTVLSVLLAVVVYLLVVGRARAEALARRITADLQEAKGRAEAALRDSRALLDTLHQFSLVSVADASGHIIEVNDAFCALSGYSRSELLGQNHRIINSGHHDAAFWNDMWHQISSGEPWSGEVCNRAKDGSHYWVHNIIAPFCGADGCIEKYVSIRTDITALKQAEQELRERAERYKLAIEGGNDGIWDWMDLSKQTEWWSPQCYRLLGYEPGEFTADLLTFGRLLHPAHREANSRALKAAFDNVKPYDVELMLLNKAGDYRWYRVRAKVYFDERGRPYRMAGSLQDVHERHLAQDALNEYSARLSAVLRLSPDGFVSFGGDGRVTYASPAVEVLTGLAEAAVVGRDETAFLGLLLERSTRGGGGLDFEALRALGGSELGGVRVGRDKAVLEMAQSPRRVLELGLSRGEGDVVSKVLYLRDITRESELDRMKSDFLSMAAHELRTPMSSIYGFTELLLTRDYPTDKRQDLLGRIHRQSESMMHILGELLDLARLEARRGADFTMVPLDLAAVVGEVLHDFSPPLQRAAPALVNVVAAQAMEVRADRQKLKQALLNLLSNAYKYSPQGGAVSVGFERVAAVDAAGGEWRGERQSEFGVRVSDQGIGMTPEQLAHVGERFYRADKSGSIPGTGLGVSIVNEIAELMGGRLEIRSEVGRGTQVTLWLPALAAPELIEPLQRAGPETCAAPLLD